MPALAALRTVTDEFRGSGTSKKSGESSGAQSASPSSTVRCRRASACAACTLEPGGKRVRSSRRTADDALVVVESGEVELERRVGIRRRFPAGAIMWSKLEPARDPQPRCRADPSTPCVPAARCPDRLAPRLDIRPRVMRARGRVYARARAPGRPRRGPHRVCRARGPGHGALVRLDADRAGSATTAVRPRSSRPGRRQVLSPSNQTMCTYRQGGDLLGSADVRRALELARHGDPREVGRILRRRA